MIAKFASFAVLSMTTVLAQTGAPVGSSVAASNKVAGLPSAPVAQTLAQSAADSLHIPGSAQQAGSVPASAPVGASETPALPAGVPGANPLSLKDAEQLTLKNNPQISVARLTALASQQVVREQRSALWPTAVADLTGVDSEANSRITAGGLNNPLIYERAAVGASVSQLITDFGRTSNLVSSARLAAKAQDENALATAEQIRLATDQAFYNALQAHSVTQVAQQTLNARQAVADQIRALFNSKLKSQLDLSFANVNLSQAKLLLLDSQNNENASMAALSAVLGFANLKSYQLVEDTTPLVAPTANVDDLISQSFAQRPELLALGFEYQSAKKFQTAERDLLMPAIRAAGAIGDTPVRNPALSNWYGAVGVNIDIRFSMASFIRPERAKPACAPRQQMSACATCGIESRVTFARAGLMPAPRTAA